MSRASAHDDPPEHLAQAPAVPHQHPSRDRYPEPDPDVIAELEKTIFQIREALLTGASILRSLEEVRDLFRAGSRGDLGPPDGGTAPPACGEPPDSPFTAQELRILTVIGQGHSNRYIARTLGISEKTVKNHIYSIFRKLDVHSRTEAVVVAIKRGWLKHDRPQ
ncbi:response regulator transcription factor [Spirillospora sp. NPDC127200]